MAQTIYRKPVPPPAVKIDVQDVLSRVRKYERSFRSRWVLMIVLGMIALWIGPLLAATILWVLQFHVGGIPDSWGYLFAWSIGLIPLLFLMEWMTRGAFMDDAVDGIGGTDNMSASFSHRQMATLALLTEISLWGPRIILTALRRLSGASRLGRDPQPAAAAVLAVLLRREDGTPSATVLTQSGLAADPFGDALAYLTYHEWIDISKDGLQLWILTAARKRLV
ncbi:MAG: hypothetical protein JWN40_4126 [Phycisphaerales bacterium]|nr:hypothetical protein [Phycisphaerales bacterium]